MSMIKRGRMREAIQEVLDRDEIVRSPENQRVASGVETPAEPLQRMSAAEHLAEARRKLEEVKESVRRTRGE